MSDESILNQKANAEPTGNVLDILGKLMSSGTAKADTEPASEKPAAEPSILSSLLSNPELISKLPELISVISPLMSNLSSQAKSDVLPSVTKSTIPASATPTHTQDRELQNRSALLCALKPYLKKERQDAIDYMIKLSRLSNILKTL